MGTDVSAGIVSVTDAAGTIGQDANTFACSEEQIFSPISVRKGGGGGLFGFEGPSGGGGGKYEGGHLGATSSELSPYFSQFVGDDGTTWMEETDFQMVANNASENDFNIRKTNRSNISLVQTTGLRGPMMLSGWGTDLADKPVPSQGGSGEDAFKFDPDAIGDRRRWKSGPVALQWDYQRKVWSGGPQIVYGVATGMITAPSTPCSPTNFGVTVFRIPGQTTGTATDCLLGETITCTNYDVSLSQEHVPGYVFVVAARINYKWIPLWVGCPEAADFKDADGNHIWPGACVCNGAPDPEPEDPDNPDDPLDPGSDSPSQNLGVMPGTPEFEIWWHADSYGDGGSFGM